MGGAFAAEQAVEQREVGCAEAFETTVAVAEDVERELADHAGALRRDEDVWHPAVRRFAPRGAVFERAWGCLGIGEVEIDLAEHPHVLDQRIDECSLQQMQRAIAEVRRLAIVAAIGAGASHRSRRWRSRSAARPPGRAPA